MRIDDDTQDQRLSLEITPLIDIIFLLVLFFAVTTSFINPEELDELKVELLNLNNVKQKLLGEIRKYTAQVNDQSRVIQKLKDNYNNLNFDYSRVLDTTKEQTQKSSVRMKAAEARAEQLQRSIATLEQSQGDLQQKLTDQTARSREVQLQSQKLDTALRTQLDESGRLTNALAVLEDKTKQLELLLGEKAGQNQKMELTIAALEQDQGNLQLRLADQTARSQEVQQQNEKLEKELRDQMDKSGRLTNTIAGLLDENENLQQVFREKTAQNQKLDQLLVKARQNSQTLSTELTRFKLDKEDWETNEKLLRTKISQLEGQLVEFRELEKLKQKRVESLNQAQKNIDAGLKTHLEKNQLGIQRKQNRLILQLSDQILFDSGSADVKPGGQAVLRKVGEILKADLGNMLIQIGGHTDNVPLSSTSGSLFSSNWELSAARAVNVVHFFEGTLGIDPERMSAVGYSEHQPIASNTTQEGRARNRRIEIVVVQP